MEKRARQRKREREIERQRKRDVVEREREGRRSCVLVFTVFKSSQTVFNSQVCNTTLKIKIYNSLHKKGGKN